jgi:N-acetylated-alpha-linked acidic dipeptidase
VSYLNTDMNYLGRFDPGGVPSLRDFIIEVARDVPDGAGSVYDAWRASEWARQPPERRREGQRSFEVELKALGSGADFVPFQNFLGLPTLSLEFVGPAGYGFGTYHSAYDTPGYVERVADPGFAQGAVLARLLGSVALRLAGAEVLPFRFSHYGRHLTAALRTVPSWGVDGDGRTLLLIDVANLESLASTITSRAEALEQAIDVAVAAGEIDGAARAALNDRLARMEQRLLDETRPADQRWFRHVYYGWNIYSLYDGQPFPGLAEAVRLRDTRVRDAELEAIRLALERFSEGLAEARALLERVGRF